MAEFTASFSIQPSFSPKFSNSQPAFAARFTESIPLTSGIVSQEINCIRILDLAEYKTIAHDKKTLYFVRG